jgi:adenylate kinase family enzyme
VVFFVGACQVNLVTILKAVDMRWKSVLLVGPTGSGKTPLGHHIEKEGLMGNLCLHFDFGEALRTSVNQLAGQLKSGELDIVGKSLRNGTLLENEHFPIAKKLLLSYLAMQNVTENTLIVLNGLPRHVGQAMAMEVLINMKALVSLECEPVIVWERIRIDSGGDRVGRNDDTLDEVKQRFDVFRKRTTPLLNYYHGLGVPVLSLYVGPKTTAQDMYMQLLDKWSEYQ